MQKNQERTYVMIKPDGVHRGLVGTIITRFEQRGFKLIAMKLNTPTKELLENHYGDLKTKKFFPSLIEYMQMGPVVSMVWEGLAVVKTGRMIVGATNPLESTPGTLRGDYCIDTGRNIIHASDKVEAAEEEIKMWFTESEINKWTPVGASMIYE